MPVFVVTVLSNHPQALYILIYPFPPVSSILTNRLGAQALRGILTNLRERFREFSVFVSSSAHQGLRNPVFLVGTEIARKNHRDFLFLTEKI